MFAVDSRASAAQHGQGSGQRNLTKNDHTIAKVMSPEMNNVFKKPSDQLTGKFEQK